MQPLKIMALVAITFLSLSSAAFAGNCNYSSDTASDGSRCGGRAADQRPGGDLGGNPYRSPRW